MTKALKIPDTRENKIRFGIFAHYPVAGNGNRYSPLTFRKIVKQSALNQR